MADGRKSAVGAANAISVGAGAAAVVLPANSERLSAVILNNSAGVVYLGSGTAGLSAANGLPLAAGASLTDTTSGDAWAVFNGQAGAADIRVMETSQV